jgi:hypothetical protein
VYAHCYYDEPFKIPEFNGLYLSCTVNINKMHDVPSAVTKTVHLIHGLPVK